MEEVEAYFSRKDLKNFLQELAKQVESGKVRIQIPGESGRKLMVVPDQPMDLIFKWKDERDLSIEIQLEEKRETEA